MDPKSIQSHSGVGPEASTMTNVTWSLGAIRIFGFQKVAPGPAFLSSQALVFAPRLLRATGSLCLFFHLVFALPADSVIFFSRSSRGLSLFFVERKASTGTWAPFFMVQLLWPHFLLTILLYSLILDSCTSILE